jgi:hypothetical protein
MKPSIVFIGLARDVDPFLKGAMNHIYSISKICSRYKIIIYENDSNDYTKRFLNEYKSKDPDNFILFTLDGLSNQILDRTQRLAYLRNRGLQHLTANYADYDIYFPIDLDLPNSGPANTQHYEQLFSNFLNDPQAGGYFPNSLPFYYDIWALRAKEWCEVDCWEQFGNLSKQIGKEMALKICIDKRQIFLDPNSDPIEVTSAFGGAAIYKVKDIADTFYNGLNKNKTICEHVYFNQKLLDNGLRLYIQPYWTNLSPKEHVRKLKIIDN